jgi:hypothetical protein
MYLDYCIIEQLLNSPSGPRINLTDIRNLESFILYKREFSPDSGLIKQEIINVTQTNQKTGRFLIELLFQFLSLRSHILVSWYKNVPIVELAQTPLWT